MFSTAPFLKHLHEDKPRSCRPLRAISLNGAPQSAAFRLERLTPQRSMSALEQLSGHSDVPSFGGVAGQDENTTNAPDHSKQDLGAAAAEHNTDAAIEPLSLMHQDGSHAAGVTHNNIVLDSQPAAHSGASTADHTGEQPATDHGQDSLTAAGIAEAQPEDAADARAAVSNSGAHPVRLNPPKVARDDSWPAIKLESPVGDHHSGDAPAAASPTASSTPVWKATPVPAAVDVSEVPEAAMSPKAEAMPPLPPPHPATPGKAAAGESALLRSASSGGSAKAAAAAGEVVRASDKVDEVRESPVKVTALAQQLASPAAQPPKAPGVSPRLTHEHSATKAAALSTHDAVNTVNVAVKLQSGEFSRKPGVDFVPYEELVTLRLEDGIDATRKEEYLSDTEFEKVFGMDWSAYGAMPQWKRLAAKKQVNLF